MSLYSGRRAVVTGATSGIGRAIAIALAREGTALHLVGRNPEALRDVAREARSCGAEAFEHRVDLSLRGDIESLGEAFRGRFDRVDLLVHGAGLIVLETIEHASLDRMDLLYRVNVAAPRLLTSLLLPSLKRAGGDIVFINSSLGVRAKAGAASYAASKHALRALADAVRQEVNERGIRVLSVYPGKTATPMQEALCRAQGVPYEPEKLLQPEDIARILLSAVTLQRTAEVTDIQIRGMRR